MLINQQLAPEVTLLNLRNVESRNIASLHEGLHQVHSGLDLAQGTGDVQLALNEGLAGRRPGGILGSLMQAYLGS